MSANRLRIAIIAVALLGVVSGCRSVPPLPESARARGYTSDTPEDGWLYRKLTGQDAARPQAEPSSGVTRTSAEEPIPGQDSPSTKEPILRPDVPAGSGYAAQGIEKSDDGFDLDDLAPEKVYKKLKTAVGYGPNEGIARALYQEGQDLYKQEKYAEAAKKFASAADRWPDSPLEEDSLFWLGESHFFADHYPKANDAYGQLLKKYDYTRHLDRVIVHLFAIGRYWEQLAASDPYWQPPINFTDSSRPLFDTFGYGVKAYETIRLHDPTGPLADDSIMATANAYFVRGRFEEAAYHYDLIRKEYPKSEFQIKAHLLGMKSNIKMYQGSMYEGKPLKDAGEIAEQALVQFGRELGDERKLVIDTKNRVTEDLAMRDWSIGQYYDKKAYYGAARYYYQAILDEYPRTTVARMAEQRLNEIRDLPAEPPNHFKWLTDVLSSKE
jgi:TolA-binding protein